MRNKWIHSSDHEDVERVLLGDLAEFLIDLPAVDDELRIADRWLLSSAMQKAIRRGLASDAIQVAMLLYELDPAYAWRRLRVIAIEDVGTGGSRVVASTIAVAGKVALRARLGDRQLLAGLVKALCDAEKDRTACDLLCWVELSPAVGRFRSVLLSTPDRWEALARDGDRPIWERVVAAQLLCGLTVRSIFGFRAVSKANMDAWRRVVQEMSLDALSTFTALRGTGTESLNAALPFAALLRRLAKSPPLPKVTDFSDVQRINGLLSAAFCKHTRLGRLALQRLVSADGDIRRELNSAKASAPIEAAGFLLFQVEGDRLDRFVDYAPHVRAEAERAELACYGIEDGGRADELRRLMERALPRLDEIRLQIWREQRRGEPRGVSP